MVYYILISSKRLVTNDEMLAVAKRRDVMSEAKTGYLFIPRMNALKGK